MSLELSKKNEINESDSEYGSDDYDSEEDFLNPVRQSINKHKLINQDFASILGAQQRIAALKTPTAMYGIIVPAGGDPVPLIEDEEVAQAVRITMAAIDISEGETSTKACTVKVIRRPVFNDDDEESDVDEEDIAMHTEEFVLCTVKAGVIYQQTLDVSFSEGESIFFVNTGDCDVHLSGNYMTPIDEPVGQDQYDSDEDLEDEDDEENELIDGLAEEADSEDELDEIDMRISELEEAEAAAKPSKKRRASADADLDVAMDEASADPKVDKKLTKKERKKMKAANGEAAAAPVADEGNASEDSAKKSVSFSTDTKSDLKVLAGGVSIDDKKIGEGPSAKAGSKLSIRYIGKLKSNNKQFDSNTKGKPLSFKVGQGEVIKGMETGVIGMKAGGERRVVIPAAVAYGSKSQPGIPANSDLIFDIKVLKIN